MRKSRRVFLAGLMGTTAAACFGQGVATHRAPGQARSKPSGLPFNARFTDVASQAALRAPTIFGPVDHKEYMGETIGCGCAFLDFDNDGWLDIFLLSGTRFGENPAGATNRLFKNNRDGSFRDVTEKSGLTRNGWACGVCVGDFCATM